MDFFHTVFVGFYVVINPLRGNANYYQLGRPHYIHYVEIRCRPEEVRMEGDSLM